MKLPDIELDDGATLLVLAAAAIPLFYLAWKTTRVIKATGAVAASVGQGVGDWIDRRRQDQNILIGVANTATEIVTVDRNQTLGGAIFDLLHTTDSEGRIINRITRRPL